MFLQVWAQMNNYNCISYVGLLCWQLNFEIASPGSSLDKLTLRYPWILSCQVDTWRMPQYFSHISPLFCWKLNSQAVNDHDGKWCWWSWHSLMKKSRYLNRISTWPRNQTDIWHNVDIRHRQNCSRITKNLQWKDTLKSQLYAMHCN